MYKAMLHRDEMINGYLYDDISYALANIYGLKEVRGISFKELSKDMSKEDIDFCIRFAHLNHTLPFPQSVSDLSEDVYHESIESDSDIDIPTYTKSEYRISPLKRVVGILSKEEDRNPVDMIYTMFSNGVADDIILEDDNYSMLPPTNVLVDRYRNIELL